MYADSHSNWPKLLPGIMMAFRMSPAPQSTQFSPFELVFGKQMRLPIDTSLRPNTTVAKDFKTHLEDLVSKLKLIREIATTNIQKCQQVQKTRYDQNSKVPQFKQGDKVWLSVRKFPVGVSPKLCSKWDGPFFISNIGPNATFKLTRCTTNKPVKSYIHANRLKPYNDPEFRTVMYKNNTRRIQPDDIPIPPAQPDIQQLPQRPNPDQFYEIEKLLGKKQIRGKTYFRVKWVGFQETTWEPQDEIPPLPLQEFYTTHTKAGKRRKRKFFTRK